MSTACLRRPFARPTKLKCDAAFLGCRRGHGQRNWTGSCSRRPGQGQRRFESSNTKTDGSTNGQTKSDGTASSSSSSSTGSPALPPTPLPLWQRLGPLSTVFKAYGRSARSRPYVTQFCSTLVVYFTGDMLAQYVGGDEYNPWRTARTLVIGGLFSIPGYHWFLWLGNNFNYPSSKVLSMAAKVLVNQLVFTPTFNTYFFGMQAALAGANATEVWERVKTTVPVSFINSWKLWPAVTVVNFTYVPPQYRAIFAGCVAVGWQTYLSWLNRTAERAEQQRVTGAGEQSLATVAA